MCFPKLHSSIFIILKDNYNILITMIVNVTWMDLLSFVTTLSMIQLLLRYFINNISVMSSPTKSGILSEFSPLQASNRFSHSIRYKHRVLCYLLSHVNGIGLRSAQVQLLGSLEGISDKSKAMILKSTLSNLSDMASSTADTLSKDSEELTSLLLACLDSSVTEDLNDSRSELWNIYISIINSFFKSGRCFSVCYIIITSPQISSYTKGPKHTCVVTRKWIIRGLGIGT